MIPIHGEQIFVDLTHVSFKHLNGQVSHHPLHHGVLALQLSHFEQ